MCGHLPSLALRVINIIWSCLIISVIFARPFCCIKNPKFIVILLILLLMFRLSLVLFPVAFRLTMALSSLITPCLASCLVMAFCFAFLAPTLLVEWQNEHMLRTINNTVRTLHASMPPAY